MDDGINELKATFTYSDGDIFEVPSDMLVNPVNCKGVSGKGLALEFKKRFPVSQKKYEEVCRKQVYMTDATGRRKKVAAFRPGDILHFIDIDKTQITKPIDQMEPEEIDELLTHRHHLVYLPTKNHWKNPSKYEYVRSGIKALADLLGQEGLEMVNTVSIPALGCGLGSLEWGEVEKIIREELSHVEKNFILFPPK